MSPSRKGTLLLFVALLYLLFRGIGDRGLLDPLEGVNASVALNMAARQDAFVPMVGDLLWYGGKTDGFWWLSSLAIRLFGWNEFSVRFWSAAAALGTAAVVWFTAGKMRSERAGNYAAVVIGTGLLTFIVSQLAASCSLYVFCTTLALAGAVHTIWNRRFALLLHAASMLALIVQGPSGAILPWLALLLGACLIEEEHFFLGALVYLPGLLTTLLMGTGYLLLLYFKNPFMLTLMRYNPPAVAFDTLSWATVFVLAGLCPWFGFYIEALSQVLPRRRDDIVQPEHRMTVLLSVWSGVFLFFGFFSGDGLLVAAAFPALAALCGDYFAKATEEGNILAFQRAMLYEIGFMVPFLCFGLFRIFRNENGVIRSTITSMAPWAFFCCLFLFAGWYYARTRQPKKLMLHTSVASLLCLLPLAGAFQLLSENASLREAGRFLRENLADRDIVVQYAMNRPSLFFYTARDSRPTLTAPLPALAGQKIMDPALLLRTWNGSDRVFMLIEHYQRISVPLSQEIYNLKEAQGLVVLSNRRDREKVDFVPAVGIRQEGQ